MLSITRFAVEGLAAGCVTDKSHPNFSFALESDGKNITLASATLQVGDWKTQSVAQTIQYAGPVLQPFTAHHAVLEATASNGDTARAELDFETGRMDDAPWQGQWISDPAYHFTEKKVSPLPMVFRKAFRSGKPVAKARLYVTAMGIYELELNGQKVGSQWFAPGFTSYKTNLQYQTYDVTRQLGEYNTLVATVAGGWAVGSFVFTRVNRVTADRQALLAELRITYTDGSEEVIGTDSSWQVTEDGPVRMADWYDGETYDATVDMDRAGWHASAPESLRVSPAISAEIGAPVKIQKVIKPISCTQKGSELIYDFGQNFAGVVQFTVKGRAGQVITIRHAEILNPDGSLNTVFLRSAKATLTYTCREGVQTWHPRFTYMGFRYISVTGVDQADLTVEALALWSDVRQIGSFECSNKMLNQLQSNIQWGARSNFMDIPTDCPQRDERMGWTGDIAVFAPTACFNFDMGRFLKKWLRDVKNEQLKTGGIPNTVPVQGYGFPATMPEMAIAWWGDACVLVPWAMYQAMGLHWSGMQKGLCTNFLRDECGMTGIVVTDMWYGTASTYMNLPQMLLAGGNLIDGMMDASHLDACAPGNNHSDVSWALRESMHRILYTVVHSNAMNGISVNTTIEHVTPWWQTALLAVQIVCGIGLAASLVLCALSARKKKRNRV